MIVASNQPACAHYCEYAADVVFSLVDNSAWFHDQFGSISQLGVFDRRKTMNHE